MKRFLFACAFVVLGTVTPATVRADVKLPAVIGSHMVLQRDRPLPIWGWAEPGEAVSVTFEDQKVSAKADDKGRWKVTLNPVKADGKAHTMTIAGKNNIVLEDILIGEVWLGSGQSNMEWSINASQAAKVHRAEASKPNIRLMQIPRVQSGAPAADVKASWEVCSPKTIGRFSAVLYHFGDHLQKELNVPVGLINASWGGSPIEPWIVEGKKSGGMYNGMIAPLQPFTVKGFTWYQGESNVGSGMKYRDNMDRLIKGWRGAWGAELPFYFVQIAPWSGYGPGKLPPLWEAQVASLKIPGTGMTVMTDLVDNIRDIHPGNKQPVGHRLALWALAKDYGKKDLVYSGPLYKGIKIDGGKARIQFAHVGGGLQARDGKALSEFEIAGKDGKFVAAEATIDGATVVVHSAAVAQPTQVRFGWRNTPNPNLMNKEGLPASPFRSQNWQGGTAE
ncbi:MAG: sialate O-acetylesterase [Planctomycetes bacterium]|nr:sialate O-acetylesterase [Planctomycetota bacterium]